MAAYGTECNSCTCESGCEGDGGAGTPRDWRPGKSNPFGSQGTSSNGGPIDLSSAQKTALVAQHNFVRAYHGACPIEWSDAITQVVKDTALSSWNSCSLSHTSNSARSGKAGFSFLGENLASASSMYYANNFPVDLKTMAWYLEEYFYNYNNPGSSTDPSEAIGHFTQVVWKETTHVGCVMYQCDYTYGKKVLLACQYGPGGNMQGAYGNNVGERGTTATCTNCGGGQNPPPTASPTASPAVAGPQFNPTCSDGESAAVTADGVSLQWTLGEAGGVAAIRFRLSMQGAGASDYFALGIGDQGGMKSWDVHAAYPQGGSCSGDCIGDYWSAGTGKPTKDASQDVNLISATSEEVLFWRPIAQTEAGSDLDISGEQKLWYAKGKNNPSDRSWGYHQGRGVLTDKACFTCGGCGGAPPSVSPSVSPSSSPSKSPTASPSASPAKQGTPTAPPATSDPTASPQTTSPSSSPLKGGSPTNPPDTSTPTASPATSTPSSGPVRAGSPTNPPATSTPTSSPQKAGSTPTAGPQKAVGSPTTSPATSTPTSGPQKAAGSPTTSPATSSPTKSTGSPTVTPPTKAPLPKGSPTESPDTTRPTGSPTVTPPTKGPLPVGSPTESPATSMPTKNPLPAGAPTDLPATSPPTSPPLGQGETHRPTMYREAADYTPQEENEKDDSSWVPYVLFSAGGVLLLCGLGVFLFMRRRKGPSIAKFFEETECGTDGMEIHPNNQSVPAGMVGHTGYGELPMTSI